MPIAAENVGILHGFLSVFVVSIYNLARELHYMRDKFKSRAPYQKTHVRNEYDLRITCVLTNHFTRFAQVPADLTVQEPPSR